MNKLYILILVLIMVPLVSVIAQTDNESNFYYITAEKDAYFDSISTILPDTVKIPGYKNYQRWKDFWEPRIKSESTQEGSFKNYLQNIEYYSKNPNELPDFTNDYSWEYVGPGNLETHNKGIVVSLFIDGDNINKIYAGTNASGLFKTINGGQTWENVTDNIGIPAVGVYDIATDPNNSSVKYIGLGNTINDFSYGIYKTTDDCQTWEQVLSLQPEYRQRVRKIAVHPSAPSFVYALIDGEVHRSNDSGNNWEVVFDELEHDPDYWDKNKNLIDLEFKPNDPNTVFISSLSILGPINHLTSAELWYSENAQSANVSWQRIENGLPDYTPRIALASNTTENNKIYVGYAVGISNAQAQLFLKSVQYPNYSLTNIFDHIYPSNNYSSAFSGMGYYKFQMEFAKNNTNKICFGGNNLTILDLTTLQYDDYNVGSQPHNFFHVDQRAFKTIYENGVDYLYSGNDGGVSLYNINSQQMSSLNGTGLNNNQFFGIGHSEIEPDFFIGGTQDNGVIGNGTGNFLPVVIGDAYEVIIDPIDPSIVYATANGGTKSANKSLNYGANFTSINNGVPFLEIKNKGLNNRPFLMSPFDNTKLYIAYSNIWKTIDAGNSWQQYTNFHNNYSVGNAIIAVSLTEADKNTMYVAYKDAVWGDTNASRFFKTEDDGQSWTDLTYILRDPAIGQPIYNTGISDIYISPVDKDQVFVSFGGFKKDNNGNAICRVLKSDNGFNTCIDITSNLPNLPINDLDGMMINNELFIIASNDLGIFVYNSTEELWEDISNGMPPAVVPDIEVNYSGYLMAATYGRGIWRAELPCNYDDEPFEVTGTTIFNSKQFFNKDIYVNTGAILKINYPAEIFMVEDAQITIEPGGQLIVDGGTITNACGDFWQGIVVKGQQNQPQTTQYQGSVRLMNGATIENAVYGVQLFDRQTDGEPAETTAGGLLIATDATFKNNKKAIVAGYYNYSGSYIQNCDFIIDGAYYERSSSQPFFVDLHHINAFYFRQNHFKNEVTDASITTSQLPVGVRSYNAGLQIKLDNIFENLQYGVKATENNFSNVSEISSNTFTKNLTGIYMSGVLAPQIFYNEFEAVPFSTALPPSQTFTGIYLDGVQGHSVEENIFFSDLSGTPSKIQPGIGLVVNNGGAQDVEVYLNTFEFLDYAILAQNSNRSSDGLHGLCIKCNEFNHNGSDISVTVSPLIQQNLAGIAINQGSGAADDNAPAGNLFSELNSNLQWQFNNLNGVQQQITYWHHDPTGNPARLVPNPNYSNNVLPILNIYANYTNACQSKQVGGGSGGIGKTEAMALLDNSQTEFESTESNLLSLTDEGNTPALQTEVNTSTPDESYQLRNELLDVAPYTSEDVLIDATEKEDVLTDALIRDVLVANPQAAKSDEVLEAIENRSAAMPQYMKDQIAAGASLVSEKEELEAKSFYFKTAYTNALNDLLFIYMSDTTLTNPIDSVIAQLEAANYLYAKYQLANIYLTLNEFDPLNATLSSIPENFVLKDELLTEYEQVGDYFEIMIDLYNSNRNINQLTESEIADLTYWYENESNLAAIWALNVLRESGNIAYQEPYILPDDELKSSTIQIQSSGSTGTENHELLQVYPNPANDYMVCEYQLEGIYNQASISMLQSGSAKALFTRALENSQDAIVIDLAEYKSGNYLMMLIVDGKTIETKSINIIK